MNIHVLKLKLSQKVYCWYYRGGRLHWTRLPPCKNYAYKVDTTSNSSDQVYKQSAHRNTKAWRWFYHGPLRIYLRNGTKLVWLADKTKKAKTCARGVIMRLLGTSPRPAEDESGVSYTDVCLRLWWHKETGWGSYWFDAKILLAPWPLGVIFYEQSEIYLFCSFRYEG